MRQRSCPFCGGTITSWQPSSWNHSSPACYQFHDFDYFEAFGALVAKMFDTSYELVNAGQLRMLGVDSADEEATRLEAEHRRRSNEKRNTMKKLLILLVLALCAFTVPTHAACSTAPTMTGVIGLHPVSPPAPPAADWITMFYRNPTKSYTMLTWYGHGPDYEDQITNANIKFGASSGVVINTGAQCVYSACSNFTSNRITTLYLPGLQADGHIDVIANGVKVGEWDGVWNRNSSSPLGAAPVAWTDGITEIASPTQFAHPVSMLYFSGWHTDATHTFPKSVRVDLANACGAITG